MTPLILRRWRGMGEGMFESLRRQAGSGSVRESGLAGDGGRRKGYATTLAILLFAATAFWPPQRDAAAETVAGVTAGALSVESSGADRYAVPIAGSPSKDSTRRLPRWAT